MLQFTEGRGTDAKGDAGIADEKGLVGARAIDRFVACGGHAYQLGRGRIPDGHRGSSFVAACPFQPQMSLTSARVWNGANGESSACGRPASAASLSGWPGPTTPLRRVGLRPSRSRYNGPFFAGDEHR